MLRQKLRPPKTPPPIPDPATTTDEFLARVVLDMAMAFGVVIWVFSTGQRALFGVVHLGEPAWTSTVWERDS